MQISAHVHVTCFRTRLQQKLVVDIVEQTLDVELPTHRTSSTADASRLRIESRLNQLFESVCATRSAIAGRILWPALFFGMEAAEQAAGSAPELIRFQILEIALQVGLELLNRQAVDSVCATIRRHLQIGPYTSLLSMLKGLLGWFTVVLLASVATMASPPDPIPSLRRLYEPSSLLRIGPSQCSASVGSPLSYPLLLLPFHRKGWFL